MTSSPHPLQRLVVVYHVGDGCTFSCEVTRPVVFEDKTLFQLNLEEAITAQAKTLAEYQEKYMELSMEWQNQARQAWNAPKKKVAEIQDRVAAIQEKQRALREQEPTSTVTVGGQTFDVTDFTNGSTYIEPTVYTVDEWFEHCHPQEPPPS